MSCMTYVRALSKHSVFCYFKRKYAIKTDYDKYYLKIISSETKLNQTLQEWTPLKSYLTALTSIQDGHTY